MRENKKVLQFDFLMWDISNVIEDNNKQVDFKRYTNTKYYKLSINDKVIGLFNFNKYGITSYAFNSKCYTADKFKKLEKNCPNKGKKNDTKGWHKHCDGYYGRLVNTGDFNIEDDKKFILKCVNLYLMELEEDK